MLKKKGQAMAKSFIFNPNHKIWQNLIVIMAFYTSMVSSFVFVFLQEQQAPIFTILDYIVNSFFCFHIALNFFVANPKTWFIFDVMCNIPPNFAGMLLHAPHLAHAMFLLLQIFWRFGKILTFFNRLEMNYITHNIRFSVVRARIAKLTWIWFFNMHLGGCIIYFIATRYGQESIYMTKVMDENLWGSYLKSINLFVSVTSARPVPDLQATPLDMVFIMLFKVVNMGFRIHVIANGIQLVALYG